MKKTAYLGLCLVLVLAALATPVFAQKIDDPAEYNAYMGVYNEKDLPKKAAAGEKFLKDYPKTTAVTQTYMMILLSYANAGNWTKTLETADNQEKMAPGLSADQKNQVLQIGMAAAEQAKNTAKLKEYSGKVLAVDAKNVGALVTMSNILANSLPTEEGAKNKQLEETLTITKRALAEPPPNGATKVQWDPVRAQLHTTAAMVLLNQKKYTDTIAEADAALALGKANGSAWYLRGLAMKPPVADAYAAYKTSVDKMNTDEARKADQLARDEMKATSDGLFKAAQTKTDELIQVFAKAVAAGGPSADLAKGELMKLFMGTPDELNKLIADAKAQLNS